MKGKKQQKINEQIEFAAEQLARLFIEQARYNRRQKEQTSKKGE